MVRWYDEAEQEVRIMNIYAEEVYEGWGEDDKP